ncbi:MAG: isocitrate lyase/phosphoenolpyruvate mutase family protein [Spirochaetaceae bacterium]|jgi:2-methylisocitrate lyase-like PEP mutase family enzyme|nr:isocitrate lyase/phosphoenolpyruvate mutase family protein [Spirochaetaceae bacterium]
MDNYKKLKKLITEKETLVVPDAYDGISARIIEAMGFKAVQCSGYSFSISKSYKKESLISLEENLSITKTIVSSLSIPVFADGEDGYGSGELFIANIEKFIKTGITGINIEDQNLWSPFYNEKLLPISESINKIRIIKEINKSKKYPKIIINARTDAIRAFENRQDGIKTAIERANRY